jgi:hypothetical protein
MMSDRVLKIGAWFYVAVLAAVLLFHGQWQGVIANPYDIDQLVAFGLAGLLMRLAYPLAPSFVCLAMIASVCGLSIAHGLAMGSGLSPLDTIVGMAGALWGVALGAIVLSGRAWLARPSPTFERPDTRHTL